tara:strand:+ start:1106 stop:1273 length:168 start_codon:yes stop_codon:yes gene_type:complete
MIIVDRIAHNGLLNLSYLPDDSNYPIRHRYMGYTEQEARRKFAEHLRSMGYEVEA